MRDGPTTKAAPFDANTLKVKNTNLNMNIPFCTKG